MSDIIKPKRRPLYQSQVVSGIAVKPGFTRRLVNEVEGRVKRFQEGGWSLVADKEAMTHEKTAKVESQMGSVSRRVVNPNNKEASCRTAVWMEIPTEIHQEDQDAKYKIRAKKVEQLDPRKYKQDGSDYGQMNFN